MAVQAPPKTGFEKWQDGIDKAVGDTRWDSRDCEIRMAVDEYSICKSSPYEILEKKFDGDQERIVFRLKNRSSRCRYSVVEVERASGYNWNVSGYQSLEGFRKRDLPEWSNSPLPERQILSCSMTGPD
ncbi:hypothetical protein [Burkholderia anthina]|uniref:hypothetical protein n=1 Tax=Burkholderia anthina TaxID=179879 RepID=UPI0009BF4A20|nr:hypothetical protein [Burkholderia anthina]